MVKMFDDMSLTHIKKKIRTRIVPQGNQITLGCCRYVGAFKQFEPRLKPWEFAAVVSYDLIQSENMKTVDF